MIELGDMQFTDQDAQLIMNAAQNSPLSNMAAAAALGGALLRFQAFYKAVCDVRNAQAPAEPVA